MAILVITIIIIYSRVKEKISLKNSLQQNMEEMLNFRQRNMKDKNSFALKWGERFFSNL